MLFPRIFLRTSLTVRSLWPAKSSGGRRWSLTGWWASSLSNEVAAALPIVECLSQQLRGVSQQIERAVVETCESFHGMAQRARQAVEATKDVTIGNPDASGDRLVVTVRGNILSLLEHLQQASSFSSRVAERTRSLRTDLRRVEDCLGHVKCLARQAKLVALNGRIEASRAGKHGDAFGVVAQETNDFAVHAVDTSEMIREVVEELSRSLTQTSDELEQRASNDTSRLTRTHEDATATLDLLEATQNQLQSSLEHTVQSSDALASDIHRAIVSLQFQDTVCQRIAHVIETLDLLSQAWAPHVAHISRSQVAERTQEWLDLMGKQFTMDSERHVAFGQTVPENSQPVGEPGSVELF